MKRIKVFYLINSMAMGGAERQMAELVRRLPRDRYEPVLCLLDETNAYPHLLPPDQPRYAIGSPLGPGRIRRLYRVLADERPQIVHSFMEYSNLWTRVLGPMIGSNRPILITSVRSRMMRPDYRLVEALLATRCDRILVNSVGTRDELIRWQRVPRAKIRVVRNIVDFAGFAPASEERRNALRKEFGLTGCAIVIPGRISIAKNQLGLCLALAYAKQRRWFSTGDLVVLLAGRVYDSWVAKSLRTIVKATGLEHVFRYVGALRNVEDLYAVADYVMLPSLYEGLPNAALEAHASGVPLLMSHSANLDRVMEPGLTGIEFRTGSVLAIANTVREALQIPEAKRKEMGRAGRERVLARFDPDAALDDTLRIYDELLAGRPEFA